MQCINLFINSPVNRNSKKYLVGSVRTLAIPTANFDTETSVCRDHSCDQPETNDPF